MAVNITWSTSNGGSSITDLDHGEDAAGTTLTDQEIYVRHDGASPITACKFYLAATPDASYTGSHSPSDDLAELLSWGDGEAEGEPASSTGFGGFQINMDATGAYAESWPSFGSEGDDGDPAVALRTGVGDSQDNGVTLHTSMGISTAGEIPVGTAPNVRFRARIVIPEDETTPGTRQVDQRLKFTFTS